LIAKTQPLPKKENQKGGMGILNEVTYSNSRPMINYQTLTEIDLFSDIHANQI
jgi:hypothetical protein